MNQESAQPSQDEEDFSPPPWAQLIELRTMGDVQRELARVYRLARGSPRKMPIERANGLAHILQCVTKTIELRASDEVLERLDKLEAKVAQ